MPENEDGLEQARQPTIEEVLEAVRSQLTRPVAMEDIVAVQRQAGELVR
jgi:hypothetical protein